MATYYEADLAKFNRKKLLTLTNYYKVSAKGKNTDIVQRIVQRFPDGVLEPPAVVSRVGEKPIDRIRRHAREDEEARRQAAMAQPQTPAQDEPVAGPSTVQNTRKATRRGRENTGKKGKKRASPEPETPPSPGGIVPDPSEGPELENGHSPVPLGVIERQDGEGPSTVDIPSGNKGDVSTDIHEPHGPAESVDHAQEAGDEKDIMEEDPADSAADRSSFRAASVPPVSGRCLLEAPAPMTQTVWRAQSSPPTVGILSAAAWSPQVRDQSTSDERSSSSPAVPARAPFRELVPEELPRVIHRVFSPPRNPPRARVPTEAFHVPPVDPNRPPVFTRPPVFSRPAVFTRPASPPRIASGSRPQSSLPAARPLPLASSRAHPARSATNAQRRVSFDDGDPESSIDLNETVDISGPTLDEILPVLNALKPYSSKRLIQERTEEILILSEALDRQRADVRSRKYKIQGLRMAIEEEFLMMLKVDPRLTGRGKMWTPPTEEELEREEEGEVELSLIEDEEEEAREVEEAEPPLEEHEEQFLVVPFAEPKTPVRGPRRKGKGKRRANLEDEEDSLVVGGVEEENPFVVSNAPVASSHSADKKKRRADFDDSENSPSFKRHRLEHSSPEP